MLTTCLAWGREASALIEPTPEIIGPGIKEEYADALQAIAEVRAALGPRELTNSTPDGRLLLNLQWLEREIDARRIPIPLDRGYYSTAAYLIASRELDGLPDLRGDTHKPLGRLVNVLDGTGLMKPRHRPVLIAMMDDFLADAQRCPGLSEAAQNTLADIAACRDEVRRGGWPEPRRPQDEFHGGPELTACIDNASNRLFRIKAPLFDGWRPYPARKPPLPAPVPGLPRSAPPLPPELAGRLP
jgi:hypothetical protein